MQLGETIATYDLGQALRGESGKFEVTSPAGETYHVTCRPNHSISNMEWAGSRVGSPPFLIRKITEVVASSQATEASGIIDAAAKVGSTGSPFLIESGGDAIGPSREEDFSNSETAILELFSVESETSSGPPSVWVCVKSGAHSMNADRLLTPACASINELDAEIRKLQGQLDEIRSRAKKKFYSLHAAAATA